MSPRASARTATPPQLSYLKGLASQTGTTFTFPRTARQASREIERLKALKAKHGRYLETPREKPHQAELPYATGQQPGEVIGYRATARRADPVLQRTAPEPRRAASEPFELGRYQTRSGEQRALYGIRVDGKPRIIDAAAERAGRIYTVEENLREKGGYGELKALVADYLEQAERLGRIPMAPHSRRCEQVVADA
jgi:hypothetical protein